MLPRSFFLCLLVMAVQAGASHTPTKHDDGGYDVILNFRGPDSRHTVADALFDALTRAGVRVFRDKEDMQIGEEIEEELESTITNSKIYIPIFSRDFASSKRCLRGLAKMMECRKNSSGETKKVILPIFYDVDVSIDLKLRSDLYSAGLQKHRAQLGDAEVEPWEAALKEVAKIKGWNLKDHGIAELSEVVKAEVLKKLKPREAITPSSASLVGIRERMEAITKSDFFFWTFRAFK